MDRANFVKLLQRAVQKDASDIHLKSGSPIYFRIDGLMGAQEGDQLLNEDIDGILDVLLSPEQKDYFMKRGDLDMAFTEKGVGRFRVNIFRQRGTISLVMRRIKNRILTFEQLNLPPSVMRFATMQRGLVLITGTTGSGISAANGATAGDLIIQTEGVSGGVDGINAGFQQDFRAGILSRHSQQPDHGTIGKQSRNHRGCAAN